MGHGCGYVEGVSDCGWCGWSNSIEGYRRDLDMFGKVVDTILIVVHVR